MLELPLEFDLYGFANGVGGFDQGIEFHDVEGQVSILFT